VDATDSPSYLKAGCGIKSVELKSPKPELLSFYFLMHAVYMRKCYDHEGTRS
jgi:hypothetical protein